MAEKVARLGIKRERDMMYFIKDGAVCKVPRKQPGQPKGRQEKVADGGFTQDYNYIYFLDKDGDVSRAARAVESRRKPKKAAKKPPKKVARKAAAKPVALPRKPRPAPESAAAGAGPSRVPAKVGCVQCGHRTTSDVLQGPRPKWTCSHCNAPLAVAERYLASGFLGEGGCGKAFLAIDLDNLNRNHVVIKVAGNDPEYEKLLANEFDINSALAHHNICKYFDFLRDKRLGKSLVVMEYGGASVSKGIEKGDAFEPDQAVHVISEAAKALDYAHSQRVIHHDVCPSNILVAQEGDARRVRVADFGAAVRTHSAFTTGGRGTQMANTIIGYHRYYVAPEVRYEPAHTKSDQYALALVLVSMLLGKELDEAYFHDTPLPGLSATQDRAVGRALLPKPGDRFPSCTAFADALRA